MIIKMLSELGRGMQGQSKSFRNCKKIQEKNFSDLEDYNKQMKNILEEINRKLYDTGKWISDRVIKIT